MQYEWKLHAEPLDMNCQWGLCVGKYDLKGRPLLRDAIRFDKDALASEVAKQLRRLADSVEKMGD